MKFRRISNQLPLVCAACDACFSAFGKLCRAAQILNGVDRKQTKVIMRTSLVGVTKRALQNFAEDCWFDRSFFCSLVIALMWCSSGTFFFDGGSRAKCSSTPRFPCAIESRVAASHSIDSEKMYRSLSLTYQASATAAAASPWHPLVVVEVSLTTRDSQDAVQGLGLRLCLFSESTSYYSCRTACLVRVSPAISTSASLPSPRCHSSSDGSKAFGMLHLRSCACASKVHVRSYACVHPEEAPIVAAAAARLDQRSHPAPLCFPYPTISLPIASKSL